MSPEQMRSSRDVDARADIWALGTIVHELLVGAPPFSATTMPELCARILQDPPPPLRQVRGDVPPALEAAVQRSLEKDPANRFANVAEFAAAIVEFGPPEGRTSLERVARVLRVSNLAASSPAHAPIGVSRMASTSTPTPTLGASGMRSTESTWSETSSGKRGMPVALVVGGVVAVAMAGALAIAGVLVLRRSHAKVETIVAASEGPAVVASVQAPVVPIAEPVVADAAVAAPVASTTATTAIAAVAPTHAAKVPAVQPAVQPKVTTAPPKVTPAAAASSARAPAMSDRKW
jgi:serine/threonine-protein kinase